MVQQIPLKGGSEAKRKSPKLKVASEKFSKTTKLKRGKAKNIILHKTKKVQDVRPKIQPMAQSLKPKVDEEDKKKASEKISTESLLGDIFLNQTRKMSLENLLKTLNKENKALQNANNQTTTKALDLMCSKQKFPEQGPSHNPAGTAPSKANLAEADKKKQAPNSTQDLKIAGKSLSFDSLKVAKGAKQLSKSLSVETGKNKAHNNPVGNASKQTFSSKLDKFARDPGVTLPHWTVQQGNVTQFPKTLDKRNNTTQSMYSGKDQTVMKKINVSRESSSSNVPEHSNYRFEQNEELTAQLGKLESMAKNFKGLDVAKELTDQAWKKSDMEKKDVNLCQCLHFHTKQGIRNIHIQSKQDAFGQILNKAGYFKEDALDEGIEKGASLPEKNSETEIGTGETEAQGLSDQWKAEEKKGKKGKGKNKDKKPKKLGQEQPTKLPEKKKAKKDDGKKTKKQAVLTNISKPDRATRHMRSESEEEMDYQKAMEELDILELLFLKLNIVESALIQQRSGTQRKLLQDSPKVRRLKALLGGEGGTLGSSRQTDTKSPAPELESELFLQRRKSLKDAIIRHVRNWLLLDFNDN